MVSTPFAVTFEDLAAMELIEQYATIQCVSNDVGGNLVSTAAWRGVRLRDLLARAGVAGDADQVVGRSVEGFTVGFPASAALDDRGAMVAIGMTLTPYVILRRGSLSRYVATVASLTPLMIFISLSNAPSILKTVFGAEDSWTRTPKAVEITSIAAPADSAVRL